MVRLPKRGTCCSSHPSSRILARTLVTALAAISALMAASAYPAEQTEGTYTVGPEDVISVTVARHPEFSGEFYVPADGVVNLPAAGQLQVTGKSLPEISNMVTEGLHSRLRDPEVTVSLKTPRMQRVYVLGSVQKPGLYGMKPGWRITEALAAAGGLAAGVEANDCSTTILRASTGERETARLSDVLSSKEQANTQIESGDVLSIETEETLPVYVMGKVKTPGLYRLRSGSAHVMEALIMAGGTLDDAALNRITVSHLSGASEVVDLAPAVVDGKPSANPVLRSGDMVVVPEETSRIAILGYVNEPGFYPLRNGQKLTLTDALGLAKGADNKLGNLAAVGVIRTRNGKQEKMVFDLQKFLRSGDVGENPEVMAGDVVYVPRTGKLDWGEILRTISPVFFLF